MRTSVRWWRMHAWTLGRWLAAESIVYTVAYQLLVFLLAGILGTGALGGSEPPDAVRSTDSICVRSGSPWAASSLSRDCRIGRSRRSAVDSYMWPGRCADRRLSCGCRYLRRPAARVGIRSVIQLLRIAHPPDRNRPASHRQHDRSPTSLEGAGEGGGPACGTCLRIGVKPGSRAGSGCHPRNYGGCLGDDTGEWTFEPRSRRIRARRMAPTSSRRKVMGRCRETLRPREIGGSAPSIEIGGSAPSTWREMHSTRPKEVTAKLSVWGLSSIRAPDEETLGNLTG